MTKKEETNQIGSINLAPTNFPCLGDRPLRPSLRTALLTFTCIQIVYLKVCKKVENLSD